MYLKINEFYSLPETFVIEIKQIAKESKNN